MRRIFWDLECGRTKRDDEDWNHYKTTAGVSVACAMDQTDPLPFFYTPNDRGNFDLLALVRLLEAADEVVSFNGDRFDTVVLASACALPRIHIRRSVDLLRVVLDAKGPVKYAEGSWRLGSICSRTIGEGKLLDDGAFAPQKATQGRWGELMTYNASDVVLTRKLWQFIVEYGYIIDPDGRRLEVKLNGS